MKRLKKIIKESSLSGEAYVFAQRISQARRDRKLVVLPYSMYSGSAGDLRGRAIGVALRGRGWRTVVVPPWLGLAQRQRIIRKERPDVILLQQSVHPLNRPWLYPGVPCVFDADDAYIINTPETVVPCCRQSAAVIAGSRNLANRFREHNSHVSVVWTGTYIKEARGLIPSAQRGRVITWALSDALSAGHESLFVREVLLRLAKRTKFSFRLYGVNAPEAVAEYLQPIRDAGVEVTTFPMLRYRPFVDSLHDVAIGLTPICQAHAFFQGKSFGKILGYIAADVAVVAANAIDHPLFFRHGENGMLADENVDQWVECCATLLDDPERRSKMVAQARQEFMARLTVTRCAELVDEVFSRVISKAR